MDVAGATRSLLSELPGAGPPETPSQELDDQDFLNLLLTQLQNQDPLDPADSSQMLDQISALNQVEQLQTANANLESLLLGMASLNNASAVNLIDRSVMMVGDTFEAAETGTAPIGFVLDEEADAVTVTVTDADGETVATFEEGTSAPGMHSLSFHNAVAGETYTVHVRATRDGAEVDASAAVCGQVEGLDFSAGVVQLVVGDQLVGLDSVLAVLDGASASSFDFGAMAGLLDQRDEERAALGGADDEEAG